MDCFIYILTQAIRLTDHNSHPQLNKPSIKRSLQLHQIANNYLADYKPLLPIYTRREVTSTATYNSHREQRIIEPVSLCTGFILLPSLKLRYTSC
jgi:hypothetical protein